MKSIFETEAYGEIRQRLDKLQPQSERQWGKMTPAQMLKHCQGPLNIMLKRKDYGLKPSWLISLFFKKSLYSDRPWKKNLPTARALRQTEEQDFTVESQKLRALLEEVNSQREREDWGSHPAFGTFTKEQWGKMQYKHLDHHLRQFGL